jgi:hypothetical protein
MTSVGMFRTRMGGAINALLRGAISNDLSLVPGLYPGLLTCYPYGVDSKFGIQNLRFKISFVDG